MLNFEVIFTTNNKSLEMLLNRSSEVAKAEA